MKEIIKEINESRKRAVEEKETLGNEIAAGDSSVYTRRMHSYFSGRIDGLDLALWEIKQSRDDQP